MTRQLLALLLGLASVAALAACGKKDDAGATSNPPAAPLRLALDYLPNADHVGIYEGLARGDFAKAGIDLQVSTPSDPSLPLKLVQSGKADLAISYEPELLLARDKGVKVQAIAALANRPLTSLIAIDGSKVKSVSDLKGKTIGTAGIPYQSAYLKTILQRANIGAADVKQADVGFDLVPAMLSKKVDATLGAFWNVEGVQLQRAKKKPAIVRADEAGVPTYDELVVVASTSFVEKQGERIRRFVQALGDATAAAAKDPQGATDALVKANPDLDPGDTAAQVKATLPVLQPSGSNPFGYMDPAAWERYSRWMLDQKLVSRLPLSSALTNEFLPGEGVQLSDDDAP